MNYSTLIEQSESHIGTPWNTTAQSGLMSGVIHYHRVITTLCDEIVRIDSKQKPLIDAMRARTQTLRTSLCDYLQNRFAREWAAADHKFVTGTLNDYDKIVWDLNYHLKRLKAQYVHDGDVETKAAS